MFYEYEVDSYCNPKIGANWQIRAQQQRVMPWGKMKNIIWQEHHSTTRVKSVMWAATEKFPSYLSVCQNI